MTADMQSGLGALDGVVVVEIGSRVGVGACGSLLAQLGATVVLIELPAAALLAGKKGQGKYAYRAQFSAGKLSVMNDARNELLIADLLARADVVISSSDRDDATEHLILKARSCAIICDITAYGIQRNGMPLDDGEDWQVQARTGLVATTGLKDGQPLLVPFPMIELMTAGYATAAILAALRLARKNGRGQRLDMALYDCAFVSLTSFLPRILIGEDVTLQRLGNRHAMIAPWNVYRTSDGWLLICAGSDAQWQRLCALLARPDLADDSRTRTPAARLAHPDVVDGAVEGWTATQATEDCVRVLSDAQIACGAVASIDGYPREANLTYRGMVRQVMDPVREREVYLCGSPLRMSRSGGQHPSRIPAQGEDEAAVKAWLVDNPVPRDDASSDRNMRRPLEGLRVVEIGHYTTVPLGTRLLGSLGADVIKIEPPEGEATRGWPPAHEGQGYFFTLMNSDKRSLVLDLRKDEDAQVLAALLEDADVLVENLKPGALARRGFSADALAALNPTLIYCSVSGFGVDSLYAGRPAFDSVIQAMSGVMDVLRADDVPMKTGISCADLLGAEMSVVALLAALEYRDRTGNGQSIDLSMQDVCAWLTQTAWNDGATLPRPTIFSCVDGAVVADVDVEVVELLRPLLAGLARESACDRLQELGMRASPVLSVPEAVAAPLTDERKLWFAVKDSGTTWPLLANPMRLVDGAVRVEQPMPALGRDTNAILAEIERKRPANPS